MNILLTGATGFIGRHILQSLENEGHNVTACVRNPEKLQQCFPNTCFIEVDFAKANSLENWLPYLNNIDAVINAVGIIAETSQQQFSQLHSDTPIALFKAAKQAGVHKIIQISALGADQSAQSRYHLSKNRADDTLRQLQLDWFILRPSIVYGEGAQSMALFHAMAALPIVVAIDGGQQLMQPVHVDDVVATILHCLKPETEGQHTLDLVGPNPLSFTELLQRLRTRMGKKMAITVSIPGIIAEKTAFLGKWLGEPTMTAENIRMLRQGNSASAEAIQHFLGKPTASLEEKMFHRPATQAERWHAHLYFLRPLLRLTIAIVWLWSGIVSIFFYPHDDSYQLLAATGITGSSAPFMLYGLAITDILLGLATLAAFHLRYVLLLQIIIMIAYTLVISFALPEFWLHPFGPILKNIPLILCTIIYFHLEGEKP